MDDRSRIVLFRTAREEWSETLMRAIACGILSAEVREGEIKRQTMHVDACAETLRDAGSIPAASTIDVLPPRGGGKTRDVETGHTRPVNREDVFYGAILPT